jgi:hypothetical protein
VALSAHAKTAVKSKEAYTCVSPPYLYFFLLLWFSLNWKGKVSGQKKKKKRKNEPNAKENKVSPGLETLRGHFHKPPGLYFGIYTCDF